MAPKDNESLETFGIRLDTQLTMHREMGADIHGYPEEYTAMFWKSFIEK